MKPFLSLALAPAICLSITACGGGGGGGTSLNFDSSKASAPAPISSNDDAAKLVAGLSGAVGTISSSDFDTTGDASKPPVQKSQNHDYQPPQKTTVSCSDGGTATERDDGKIEFNNCTESEDGITATLNGVVALRCDSGSLETECFDQTTEAGENGNGLSSKISFDDDDDSSTIILRGTLREEDLGSTQRETVNGDANISEPSVGVNATLFWDDFIVETTGSSFTVDGDYGVAINRGLDNCQTGRVNITTQTDIQVDNNDRTIAGAITLMNEGGSTASVTFNADNSVTVSVNGGAAETYSAGDMEEFCS